MTTQYQLRVGPFSRGYHLITREIVSAIDTLPESGLMHVFIQHTSAALCINENADPDVRHDFELYFNTIVPESMPGMRHTLEGPDDMPAHIKAAMIGNSISIPITDHHPNLGTWQGIYLCEFRNRTASRNLVVTITS